MCSGYLVTLSSDLLWCCVFRLSCYTCYTKLWPAAVLCVQAMLLHLRGNNRLAEKTLRDAVNADPTSPETWWLPQRPNTLLAPLRLYPDQQRVLKWVSLWNNYKILWCFSIVGLCALHWLLTSVYSSKNMPKKVSTRLGTGNLPAIYYSVLKWHILPLWLCYCRKSLGTVLNALGEHESAIDCLMTAVDVDRTTPIMPFSTVPKSMQGWEQPNSVG